MLVNLGEGDFTIEIVRKLHDHLNVSPFISSNLHLVSSLF